ncbi:MAG: hypothetical protein GVY16_07175 [Planctomycetes bacterium]|nr:hypothetical protein [Phycisphaerae bacterium]NBB95507.1 hypothetical protein [Planctomycetota bacterium]
MTDIDDSEQPIIALARTVAWAAAEILCPRAGTDLNVYAKQTRDGKLKVDRLREAVIVDGIREVFPGHGIVAEQSGAGRGVRRVHVGHS